MLKVFRNKNIAKFVLWGVAIVIILAFALDGAVNSGRSKGGPKYVGVIYNKKVSFDEFSNSLTGLKIQIIMNYFSQPQILDTLFKDQALMSRMAWDRIIMSREAKMRGIKVSDREVISFIRSHPFFARNGGFDDRIYDYALKNSFGLDPRTFEESMRESLAIKRSNDLITKDVKLEDDEILQFYRAENEKYKVSYVLIPVSGFTDKVTVSDDEVKDYFDRHRVEFMLPPKDGDTEARERAPDMEDVRGGIVTTLSEEKARPLAFKDAGEKLTLIKEAVTKESLTFEAACEKSGLKAIEAQLFSRSEYLDGIGEAFPLADACVKLSKDELSGVIATRKGAMILKLADTEKIDEEKFKTEKENFAKSLLEKKRTALLEDWLRKAELSTQLNIDFQDQKKDEN